MTRARGRLRQHHDGERGAVIVLVAIVLSTLIGFTSLAIDIGYQRVVRRDMQAVADVVALDLSRRLDGRTAQTIMNDTAFQSAIDASRGRNDFAAVAGRTITVELGVLNPVTHQLVSAMRTYTRVGTASAAFSGPDPTGIPDAVRVTTTDTVDYFFRPGSGTTSRSAVASVEEDGLASFSVGSYLAAINPNSNTVIGQVLNSVFPGASVLSYSGLVNARVTLGQLMVPLGVGSVNEVLTTQISYRDLVVASIAALTAQGGQTAAIAVLNGLLTAAPTVDQIKIGDLFGADLAGGSPAGSATVDVLSLLTSAVYLSDGTHFITLPGTAVGIPGIGQVTLNLDVIEVPQFGGFREGATARTGQFNLTVTPTFNISTNALTQNLCGLPLGERNILNSLVGGVLNLATCLLGGVLNQVIGIQVTADAPIEFRAAGAVTTLTDINCAAPAITLDPGPVPLRLISTANLDVRATVGGNPTAPLLRASLAADVIANGTAPPQTFAYPSEFGIPRRVGSTPLGLANLMQLTVDDLTVLGTANLNVLAGNLMTPTVNILNTALGNLDSVIVAPLARALGLSLGGTDLTALSLDCESGGTRLVG